MEGIRDFKLRLKGLMCIALLALYITACKGGTISESKSFFNFIKAVDPNNVLRISSKGLVLHPCSNRLKGVKCNLQATAIVELRLENMNLSGKIDADSLCKLQNLQVLNLAKNLIRGTIPDSIGNCRSLTHLNLSSNLLSGQVPSSLSKLTNLRTLDISNNRFSDNMEIFNLGIKNSPLNAMESSKSEINSAKKALMTMNGSFAPAPEISNDGDDQPKHIKWITFVPLVIGIGLFLLLAFCANKNAVRAAKEKEILKSLGQSPSPLNIPPVVKPKEEAVVVKPEKQHSQLVLFVEEHERFKLDDLLEAAADLRSQTLCSSLYKVILKNNAVYAVKRLKKLQVFFEEFDQVMRKIGNLKHPNLLPLVGFHCANEEKLLIYKYQKNGSLLNLLDDYIGGRRDFPWKLRLSIASGIARGLDFIYQRSDDQESIPHGNIKLSNIMLNENEEPLISEYGFSKFLDPKRNCFQFNGYVAPEKTTSEQGDVFSFGVILLELLTGKTVEKSGLDLPKWVKAMVREEWTGEVFDKEVRNAGQWAFPLLNISLKCVSLSPEDRPAMAEVLEKIEEVANAHNDNFASPASSTDCCNQQDCCLLHSVISDTWDTPGSNY